MAKDESKLDVLIDLSQPRYDQSTYLGRVKHFALLTNPLNLLATDAKLDEVRDIVTTFKKTKMMPPGYNAEKLWQAKYLYDSAFHPDTGEKMILIGRMSAQAPMNTLLMAGMLTFYKTRPAIIFWQWINQSFGALVNYTNRSGDAPITMKQILASYCAACGGAVFTAVYLNGKVRHMKNPLFARLVPFAAVCCANFINIPMMRSQELMHGTPVYTVPEGIRVGESVVAACKGIFLVCFCRCLMAVPGLTIAPYITNYAIQRELFCHRPMMAIPFQSAIVAISMTIATPLGCAIFSQRDTLAVCCLDRELKNIIDEKYPNTKEVYYNKGL